jgi:hypothetical protein
MNFSRFEEPDRRVSQDFALQAACALLGDEGSFIFPAKAQANFAAVSACCR